jgi:type I restriction enzyme S subunit
MEHVEAHSTRLLETAPAHGMRSSANRFYGGDVLYGRLRPYLNKVFRPNFSGLCSAEFIVFPQTEGIDPDFLKYRLNAADFAHFASHLNTGDRPRVDFDQLAEFEIMLPPFREQLKIVAEIEKQFTRLDAGVASLKRMQIGLKRYRASVLKAACEGRLVPTEAELARKENRGYETGEELLQRILKERREKGNGKGKYKEPVAPNLSELPALLEGWTWATFEQIASRVTVGHVGPMKHEYVERGIPFLRSQNVRENRFDAEGLPFIRPEFDAKLHKSRVQPGDLAVVRSGSVGVTCVIPQALGNANCADLVLIQQPLAFIPEFGAYYMNSLAKRRVDAGKVGVALTHFNTKSVAAMPFPLPPLAEQKRIVAEVERRLSVAEGIETVTSANLRRAARLRQSLLKEAFTGNF